MNHTSTSTWSPMVSGPEDDFANFLEFNDLQLTFPTFDVDGHDNGHDGVSLQQDTTLGMDATMDSEVGLMDYKEGQMNPQMDQHMDQSEPQLHTLLDGIDETHDSGESLLNMNLHEQHYHQQHHQQQQLINNDYQTSGRVPPTPNSIEMSGGHGRYYPHADAHAQAIYGYNQRQKEQVSIRNVLVAIETNIATDGLHSSSVPCCHTSRHRVLYARVHDSRRIFQPIDLTCLGCSESCCTAICIWYNA